MSRKRKAINSSDEYKDNKYHITFLPRDLWRMILDFSSLEDLITIRKTTSGRVWEAAHVIKTRLTIAHSIWQIFSEVLCISHPHFNSRFCHDNNPIEEFSPFIIQIASTTRESPYITLYPNSYPDSSLSITIENKEWHSKFNSQLDRVAFDLLLDSFSQWNMDSLQIVVDVTFFSSKLSVSNSKKLNIQIKYSNWLTGWLNSRWLNHFTWSSYSDDDENINVACWNTIISF